MPDDVEGNLGRSIEALLVAVKAVELDLDEIEPEFASSYIPAEVPHALERLAGVIRELPGSW
jgi:hypothetical protein